MSKIERYAGNLRAFGSNAQGLERTLFGETTQADDLTSQVTAAFLRGWGTVGPSENPSLEDFNAAMYAMSQFIAYQHQMGIPEWDAAQEYYKGSLCVRGGETYSSLVDDNIGSAPPSVKWTPVLTAKNGIENLGVPGRLLGAPKVFVTSGSYTPAANVKAIVVEIVGGGGGGGYAKASQSFNAAGGGGGAGGYSKKFIAITSQTPITYTVGQGGAGGVVNVGTDGQPGGTTTFGAGFSASGGTHGGSASSVSTSTSAAAGGVGGIGAGGDINTRGGHGQAGISASPSIAGGTVYGGPGGSSMISGQGGPGSGGQGGATTANGNRGNDGMVIIWEYA